MGSWVSKPPFIETGPLVGAMGLHSVQASLFSLIIGELGLYGFGGFSSVSGYQAGDSISADLYDRTLGFGIQGKIKSIGKFTLGAFAQLAYYGSHIHSTYFDPDYS